MYANAHTSTCVNSGEYALHGVGGGVSTIARFPRLVALGTKVKVIADQALVAFT